jgi:hypothetical protein
MDDSALKLASDHAAQAVVSKQKGIVERLEASRKDTLERRVPSAGCWPQTREGALSDRPDVRPGGEKVMEQQEIEKWYQERC